MALTYKFDGRWEFELTLPAFSAFAGRYSSESGIEPIEITIDDEQWPDPNPLPQQIAAIHYLINHQESIAAAISRGIFEVYKTFRKEGFEAEYCGVEDFIYHDTIDPEDQYEDFKQRYPLLRHPDDAHLAAGFSSITICAEHKEGYSYMIFHGSCNWDEEHGHSFIMHRDRVVELTGYEYGGWKIAEDQGLDVEKLKAEMAARWQSRQQTLTMGNTTPSEPRLEKPHPTFATYREWQLDNNYRYWIQLHKFFGEDRFIQWYKNPPADFPQIFIPKPDLVATQAARLGHEKLLTHCLKHFDVNPNDTLIESIKGCHKHLAIKILQQGGRFVTEKHQRPFAILFNQLSVVKQSLKTDQRGKQIVEMIEWLYSIGERPVDLPNLNDLRGISVQSQEIATELCLLLGRLAKRYTQIRYNAQINEALKKETLLHRSTELNNALGSLSQQWSTKDREYIAAWYLLMEGNMPHPKFISKTYSDATNSKAPHLEQVQAFVNERLHEFDPTLGKMMNNPQTLRSSPQDGKAVANAIISHHKKEELHSWGKFIIRLFKIFIR
jgi:hypothetical protein